ncbi:MAG: hypothetical protein KBE94_04460 [Paludibacteraceae bacterium]|nr:hypothetical protein [Flavobacterium sp.]MBP9970517.1 hypothetical protein [Paludibacteraceae bacterium]
MKKIILTLVKIKTYNMQTKFLSQQNILILLCFSIMLVLNNCKNREEEPKTPDCGCNSKVLNTIPESANLIGLIKYKMQLDPNDNYYNNKFWITYTEQNCGNCVHHMIVCNESILPQQVLNLKNSGGNISVKFSGQLKEICEKKFDLADITYENITLTKIQVQ